MLSPCASACCRSVSAHSDLDSHKVLCHRGHNPARYRKCLSLFSGQEPPSCFGTVIDNHGASESPHTRWRHRWSCSGLLAGPSRASGRRCSAFPGSEASGAQINLREQVIKGDKRMGFGICVWQVRRDYEQDDAHLVTHFSDGSSDTFDLLVGADGQGSRTR
ncbi:uncharacterized protein BDV14DRAFT_84306 [Aspergillus stella-maris]|uniref:uncharacterized protein n=1 Tax=Aspergillus stella-maris TaxID=1810926 RepID=UPI003CCD6DCD